MLIQRSTFMLICFNSYLEIGLDRVVVRGELCLHLVELEVLGQLLLLELHLLLVSLSLLLEMHHALALAGRALVLSHGGELGVALGLKQKKVAFDALVWQTILIYIFIDRVN